MNREIEAFIDNHFDSYLDILKSTIAIRSVNEKAEVNAPYGNGPKLCLEHVLKIGENLGFKTKMIDNVIGYVEYGPQDSDKYLGIFGHLDVVDEGTGWSTDPYVLTEINDTLYARGVLDNKAPILANLFALYTLKELGVKFNSRVRIVFGTNEELGMKDIPVYLRNEKAPYFGWTPDCKFPLVYGERGRITFEITSESSESRKLKEWVEKYLNKENPVDAINIGFYDEDFGKLILRNVIISDASIRFTLSYPRLEMDELLKRLNVTMDGLNLEVINNVSPIIYDVDYNYVNILKGTLESMVSFDATPVTTTGGTYAKLVPHIIAYGPSFPGQNNIAHLPDEWVDKSDLLLWLKIYANSIYSFKGE